MIGLSHCCCSSNITAHNICGFGFVAGMECQSPVFLHQQGNKIYSQWTALIKHNQLKESYALEHSELISIYKKTKKKQTKLHFYILLKGECEHNLCDEAFDCSACWEEKGHSQGLVVIIFGNTAGIYSPDSILLNDTYNCTNSDLVFSFS